MSNYDEIEITIFKYFDGLCKANREMLEDAFAVDAGHMKGYLKNDKDGYAMSVRPISEVINDWATRDPAPDMKGKIISINIFDDVAATALFDFNGIFTDSFQLAKVEGQWKIVNKFYINQ